MSDELKLEECLRVQRYGLARSQYRATSSDAHMAMVVALACEGVVWTRLWGLQLDAQGKVVQFMAPSRRPPTFAWMGDLNRGQFTPDEVELMDASVRRELATSDHAGPFVLGDDGELRPLH